METRLEIKPCEKCKELTPQIDNNTTGMSCQVCMHSNPYSINNAVADASMEWLVNFWQCKYYQVAGFNGGNNVIFINAENQFPCNNCQGCGCTVCNGFGAMP